MNRAGETCTVSTDCNSFDCIGVVDEEQTPPVVADTTYTFLPCEEPPSFSVFATVTSFQEPVLDVELVFNGTFTIAFNPEFLGTISITLDATENGVIFGVSLSVSCLCV